MIVAKSTVHDCSATDYPATRRSAFASGLALVGGTDTPAHRRGPAEQAMCFGTFHLLPRQRLLVENGHPVHLGSRALDILVALVERAGHVVEKRELMARIWPDSSVEESNLKVHVAALRRTLGDGLPGRRYVAASRGTPRKSHPGARVSAAAVTLRWLRDGTEQMHECA